MDEGTNERTNGGHCKQTSSGRCDLEWGLSSYLSVYLSICRSVCLLMHPSVRPFVSMYCVCLHIYLSFYLSIVIKNVQIIIRKLSRTTRKRCRGNGSNSWKSPLWPTCKTEHLHRESKKGCHPIHGYNFVNSWSIFFWKSIKNWQSYSHG